MKKITTLLSLLFVSFTLNSCSNFIKAIDEKDVTERVDNKKFSILFSNNINGETHPCGCRNFPLGGLPQVAGLFSKIASENKAYIYVDAGDTFFPSSNVPSSMKNSLSYAATSVAQGIDQLGLKLLTPGDQDFAMGSQFLVDLVKERKFKYLVSNLKAETNFPHETIYKLTVDKAELFFLGVIDPETIRDSWGENLVSPKDSINNLRKILKENGFKKNNPHQRLIVITHAGIDFDKTFPTLMPEIDWIIGSHSQSFLQKAEVVGTTRITQGLSKNHYLGEIEIGTNSNKDADKYTLHPVLEELEKEIIPNPFTSMIVNQKNEMTQIQLKEQAEMGMAEFLESSHKKVTSYKTAKDCMSCHKPQSDFWQTTPHSIAFTTLLNVNEANNLSCIGCHSLGLNDPKGYNSSLTINNVPKANFEKYWKEAKSMGSHVESVRKLPPEEIKKISVEWVKLDKKMNVSKNFANVQCLNCHTASDNHPKMMEKTTKSDRKNMIQNQCLSCHTPEQSPEWYDNGIKVNAKFSEAYKKVSCPVNIK